MLITEHNSFTAAVGYVYPDGHVLWCAWKSEWVYVRRNSRPMC